MSAREAQHPFEPGFKRTFYVYYTRKELLHAGSDVMRSVGRVIEQACTLGPMTPRGRPEEPDMIYLAVMKRRCAALRRVRAQLRHRGEDRRERARADGGCRTNSSGSASRPCSISPRR